MRCRKWAVEISKWHEGELSDAREAYLLHHLEGCRHCQSLEARFRSVSDLLKESPELPEPEFLAQRIAASVSERMRQHSESRLSGLMSFFAYRFRAAVPIGMLVIGLCVGGLAGHNIAQTANFRQTRVAYDLLALGGIGTGSQSVAFNHIWQDNGEGGGR